MQTSRFLLVVGTLVAAVLVAGLFLVYAVGESVLGWTPGRDPEPPERQRAVLATVVAGQRAAEDANDVQLVQADLDRDAALCRGLESDRLRAADLSVDDWWGTVEDIRTGGGDDEAELRVVLDHDVELVVDGDVPGQGVRPGSSLYEDVAELADGEDVLVSGRFVADPEGCLEERSLRLRNSLLTPDFAFVLTGIAPR
ncbi:hypothetical protein [Nocardioides marmoraquaticus]